ncbi:MAG: hypothetical protein CVU61_02665 [Deltaproteobacteria bacterium HGW-Deltaproteobacteria-19]|jgi:hypothetical protein|nr:MAG: hypothetical protein CVU61_02665 [Deltaproteobacteria bacterium HGW-Deltaproteobacteria-19]
MPWKKSRLLFLSIPVLMILLGLFIYEYGFLRIQEEESTIREMRIAKQRTLEKYLSLISQKPRLEKEIALLKEARKLDESKIIAGKTPALAAATLQNTVKGIVTGKGGSISSERVEKYEDAGTFKIVSISVDTTVPDTKALGDILFAIESQMPFLVIQELDARVRNIKEPRELVVKMKVAALTGGNIK